MAVLALLFLVIPFAELAVIIVVAKSIGVGNTLAALILVSIVGAWLAKREGLGVLRRVQDVIAQGRVPTNELIDGALILFAGALMLTPGFLSDLLAIFLLLPPTRALFRGVAVRALRKRTLFVTRVGGMRVGDVFEADGWDDTGPAYPRETRPPELDRP